MLQLILFLQRRNSTASSLMSLFSIYRCRRWTGLHISKKIMLEKPLPVIICSSHSQHNSANAISALDHGAIDIVEKPKIGTKEFIEESKEKIQDIVRASVNIKLKKKFPVKSPVITPKLSADVILPAGKPGNLKTTEKVIVVGASTGGTEALKDFLMMIPENAPPILIVTAHAKAFYQGLCGQTEYSFKSPCSGSCQRNEDKEGRSICSSGG